MAGHNIDYLVCVKSEGNIRYFLSPGQGKYTGNMMAGSTEGNIVPSFTMAASVLGWGCLMSLCLLPKTSVNPSLIKDFYVKDRKSQIPWKYSYNSKQEVSLGAHAFAYL